MKTTRTFSILMAAFALIAVLLGLNRTLFNLTSSAPGTPTEAASALWHLWWPTYALSTPDGLAINTFSGGPTLSNHLRALSVLQSVPFALLNMLFQSPIFALNLILIVSIVATFVLTTIFLRRHGAPDMLAAFGGLAMATSAAYSAAINGSDVIGASLWLLPLALITWDAWLARPAMWRALIVVVALYASVLAGVQNLAWIIAVWLPYTIWSARSRQIERDHVALMVLLLVILFFIFPGPVIIRTLSGFEPPYSDAAWTGESRSLIGAFLRSSPAIWGLALLGLAIYKPRGSALFWLALGFAAFVLGTGFLPEPLRMITGALALPYQPLYTRTPFLAYTVFALIVFCALAWRDAWDRLSQARTALVLGAVALILALPLLSLRNPSPQMTFEPLSAYASIAEEPEDYYVLDYPYGLANESDTSMPNAMDGAWLGGYAVWHHKRTLNGIGFFDQQHRDFVLRELNPDSFAEMVNEWRIGYVFVHQNLLMMEARNFATRLIDESGALCPAVEQQGVLIYRARWHPYGCEPDFDE